MAPRSPVPPARSLLQRYESFPCLVWALIQHGREPTITAMARHTQIGHGTLSKWLHYDTRQPEALMLQRWCAAYGLDFGEVLALVMRDLRRRALGEPVPLPDLTALTRGPRPGVLLRPIRGGSDAPQPLSLPTRRPPPDENASYRTWETRFRLPVGAPPAQPWIEKMAA